MFGLLPALAVRRPVLTTMMVFASMVMGTYSLLRLNTDLFPEVEFPVITASIVYPGAGPQEIETQVTDPLEEAVSGLPGIETLRSFSQENVAVLVIEFDLDTDQDQAAIDVKDRIDAIRNQLPDEAEPPVVQKFDIGAMPIVNLALAGPQGVDQLYDLADDELRERFSRVDGVAGLEIVGGRTREVEVLVDPDRLRAYGVTLTDVIGLIGAENVSVPSGRISEPAQDVPVRVVGEYASVQDLADLRLFLPEGAVVRLGDLAQIRDGYEDLAQVARFNQQPSVSLAVQKRSDANTVGTAAGILAEVEAINADLPPGASLTVVRDASEYIQSSIRGVIVNLLIGIGLTTVVLFLFLHSWRGTVIAAIAMPVTILATFLLIDAAGFTLNFMTLMALSITVGILVSNTIVVLENIYRHLDLGEDPHEAARKGTTEIAVAVAASTLTNVVVFTPIAFMEGIIGQFFYAFGLTVVFATAFSIFMSFTLAPLLAARLLRRGETEHEETEGWLAPVWRRWDAGYRSLEGSYGRALGWALRRARNGWLVVGMVTVFAVVTLGVATRFVGGEFIPPSDEGAIQVTVELPPGTPIERTTEVAARAEDMIVGVGEVRHVLTTISGGQGMAAFGGATGANIATILVVLEEERTRSTDATIPQLRELLADLPDAEIAVVATNPGSPGGAQAPIQLLVSGPDYDELTRLAERVAEALAPAPALQDVDNTVQEPRTELVFRPSRAALADQGLTVGQVGRLVRASIEGEIAGVFRGEVGEERDIRVRLAEDARSRTAQLADLQVRTADGTQPLGALGALEEGLSPTTISRIDRVRTVEITAQIGQGSLTDAVAAIEAGMQEQPLPPDYTWRITGEFEQFGDAVGAVLVALVLAIVLTYIVLAMILESFIHPVTIMITLPLGAVGAMLGLFLWGSSLNIFSMMAIIMLVGVVVNNAILILDYTAQLRAEGRSMVEALLEAAPTRLRPIIMTNIAIVFALIPQAFSQGDGSNLQVPMAVVTIDGVLLSAVFTLFLIPVIYTKLDRFAFAAHAHEREERERHEAREAEERGRRLGGEGMEPVAG